MRRRQPAPAPGRSLSGLRLRWRPFMAAAATARSFGFLKNRGAHTRNCCQQYCFCQARHCFRCAAGHEISGHPLKFRPMQWRADLAMDFMISSPLNQDA